MSTKILTNDYRLHVARQLLESISETSNTAYYFFLGEHAERDSSEVPQIDNDDRATVINVYRNMISAKRIVPSDFSLMVRNIQYVSNTVYTMYDDSDRDINDEDYYVIVNEGSFYHLYKCLDNNNSSRSTVTPDFSHVVGANTFVYRTSDGYQWKYMYSVSSSVYDKFATTQYFPIVANSSVESQSVDGSLDVIKVLDAGRGYDNYVTGTFSATDLRFGGNPTRFTLANPQASTVNNFYNGCLLYISSGAGAGAYRRIVDYVVDPTANNGSGVKYVVLESEFSSNLSPSTGSLFQIYPEVRITGDGSQTINAVARAIVNSSSGNSIYRVEVLERGAGYDYLQASVVADSSVLVDREASLRPVYSPPGGHGSDPARELGCRSIAASVTFNGGESNTITTLNQTQQIGILKDPLFDNVNLTFSSYSGNFLTGERFFKIDPIRINTGVDVSTLSDEINCSTGDLSLQTSPRDLIYLRNSSNNSHQLTEVSAVSNSTHLTITEGALFTDSNASMYLANSSSTGVITNIVTPDETFVGNVSGVIVTGDLIVGRSSGAFAVVNAVSRSGVTKGFSTFTELYKYEATIVSGQFTENEVVYIGANSSAQVANATLHSVINTGGSNREIYVSNQVGGFTVSSEIVGLQSGARATITQRFFPEVKFASGEVLYIENIEPLTRANSESETFKLILEY